MSNAQHDHKGIPCSIDHPAPDMGRVVYWYNCDCDWLSKYCDEHHRATARIPLAVLRSYESR